MNSSSGFDEVRSFNSRSPYRFLHEQRRRIGTGAWHLLLTHDLISPFTGISTTRENILVWHHSMLPLILQENSFVETSC